QDPLGSGGTEIVVAPPLNYATAQQTTVLSDQGNAQWFGITNLGVGYGRYDNDTSFFYQNGHVVTFTAPTADNSSFSDGGTNSYYYIAGTNNGTPAFFHASPDSGTEDLASGFFDNYNAAGAATTLVPVPTSIANPASSGTVSGQAVA